MQVHTIKNLNEVLQSHLKIVGGIKEYKTSALTQAGQNYGSLMLSLDITLCNNENLKLVAKICPPNEFLKSILNLSVAFKKELIMYSEILPTLRKFQQEQGFRRGFQIVPEFCGGRINLNQSQTVDDDAIIVLKNLKEEGFTGIDRMVGFNLETAEHVLKSLAIFHAVPIAAKVLKPDLFQENIKRHLHRNELFDALDEKHYGAITDFITDILKTNEECIPLMPKVLDCMKRTFFTTTHVHEIREPFATISHNDLWVTNILLKFDNENKPLQSILIDFQAYDYESVANDVLFFLFSSISQDLFQKHYDHLLEIYYKEFIATLEDLKCPIGGFPFELFKEEIDHSAKTMQLFHILLMLRHVFAQQGTVKEIADICFEDLAIDSTQMSNEYKKRLPQVILEYNRRNWL